MSLLNIKIVTGNLAADPELRYTPNGQAVVKLRLASTPRRLNQASNQWEDGTTVWNSVEAWGTLAENVAASLKKGSTVLVVGKEADDSYTKDGTNISRTKIVADEISPSLRNQTAVVEKKRRDQTASGSGYSAPASRPAAGGADEETPF